MYDMFKQQNRMDMKRVLKAMAGILLMVIFAMSCTKPDEPNNEGNGDGQNDSIVDDSLILDDHDYVDLGLPSGLLWATCNVGANSPEEFGDFFAWGEIDPKNVYDWKSYKYGNFERNELTKYCTDSSYGLNGFVDNLTVLESVDDAATANWGISWRMPTKEEWEELFRKTTCTWTAQNGVQGRLLTGWNGNSIFLPATGFFLDGALICPGLGIYWSSTLHEGFPERGWSFHYDLDECHVCGTYERSRGQVVRAVRSAR